MKYVGDQEALLNENQTIVNGKQENTDEINSLYYQKPNGKLLGFPLRLHIYNLARPNIDSILRAQIYANPKKLARKIKWLSKKQVDNYIESRKNLNNWIQKTGEPPVIVDIAKVEKTTLNIKKYYFSKGWFNVTTAYDIDKGDNKKATVTYRVKTHKPYILDSINPKIATPAIDTLYQTLKNESLIKKGQQYDEKNYTKERERLTAALRNSGYYHFQQDYISFDLDTIGTNKKVITDLIIKNRNVRVEDSINKVPFKAYQIKEVNIFTDYTYDNYSTRDTDTTNAITYNGYHLFSYNKLKYRPKALTNAIFITKGTLFKDLDRSRTYKALSNLKTFKYPNIEYIENPNDTTLTANIYLSPQKKYDLGFNFDVSQSNIQSVGFAFSSSLVTKNVFRGAETLELSALGSIGASKDAGNANDRFFDITEVGANLKLTIPRLFLPFNTTKIIPKYMLPNTRISIGATSQRNIGLDKQTLTGAFNYNWYPTQKVTNSFDLFNVQFVKNLNIDNYFDVYQNSYSRLDGIAKAINYKTDDTSLSIPDEAENFISDVLSNNTTLTKSDQRYIDVNNIAQRKQRLTENNLIFASNFNYVKDKRENIFDNNFSIIRFRVEFAGNFLSSISKIAGLKKNDNQQYEMFGVPFSQYAKAEVDYVKHWNFGKQNILAIRSYFGIAIPYGNAEYIPFSKSFFAGGPNDNRAWTAYNLGPGSSNTADEFNEANLKLHFSVEQRFNILQSLKGALFVDIGNIWNVLDNVEDPDAQFTGFSDLKNIAVGSGFGLRYDFNFFVLRGDIGFKTYNPSYSLGNRWFKDYNFGNAVYNIGINYPF